MTKAADSHSEVTPSATPSDADITAWQALPRDEQLRRLQAKLAHPDCAEVTTITMSDVLNRAQARQPKVHQS